MEKETRTLVVELEIPIEAKKEVIWKALVEKRFLRDRIRKNHPGCTTWRKDV